jgi:hypothetical protein
VELFTVTLVASLEPNWTVAPSRKLVPVTVTVVPPDSIPDLGETLETVGPAKAVEVETIGTEPPAFVPPPTAVQVVSHATPLSAALVTPAGVGGVVGVQALPISVSASGRTVSDAS